MVRLRSLALSWVLAASSLAADAGQQGGSTDVGSGVYILECDEGQVPTLANTIQQGGGVIRHEYNSPVFRGVSFEMSNATRAEEFHVELQKTGLAKSTWSVATNPEPAGDGEQPDAQQKDERIRRALDQFTHVAKRADINDPWTRLMTNIDKLHEKGYLGNGVRIAVIDSGVDYTHPALGGCFGKGCRVAKGASLVKGDGDPGDPMDAVGHGTKVAGVLAGYDAATGFVGAAPNATIYAYRVSASHNEISEDDFVAGWVKAHEDGAQVMVSSAGIPGSWAQRPAAVAVSRIVGSGIPCVVALGNLNKGPFYGVNPSTGRGVMAVNSVSRHHDLLRDAGGYSIDDGAETAFAFTGGQPSAWAAEALDVHDVDADYGDKVDDLSDGRPVLEGSRWDTAPDCKLSPGDGQGKDLAGRVALVRRSFRTKDCSFEQRVLNAEGRGATHVLAWSEDGVSSLKAPEAAKSIVAMGMVEASLGKALARALSAGKRVRMRRTGVRRVTTGVIASEASYGPTYDLDIKPNVLAPGEGISAPLIGGGYSGTAGTSFAAPLVAGIYALVGEARGTWDAAVLNSVIMGTAEPQVKNPGDEKSSFVSVAQQGSGLVRAWEAANVTTLVTPTSLAFNDTAHRVPSISLRIENQAKTTVQYQLSQIAAVTLYTLNQDNIRAADQTVQAPAKVQLSKSDITLGPGESATIDVSASDPDGLDVKRLPIWSGWIEIRGSDGTRQTVPYLGLAGVLREAEVLSSSRATLHPAEKSFESIPEYSIALLRNPPAAIRQQPPGPNADIGWWTGSKKVDSVAARFSLPMGGSPEVQVYAVPLGTCPDSAVDATVPVLLNLTRTCVPKAALTEVGGVQTLGQINNYTQYYVGGPILKPTWDGSLSSGQFAPPGGYKLIARALSIMGDRNSPSDWQVAESQSFILAYEGNQVSP